MMELIYLIAVIILFIGIIFFSAKIISQRNLKNVISENKKTFWTTIVLPIAVLVIIFIWGMCSERTVVRTVTKSDKPFIYYFLPKNKIKIRLDLKFTNKPEPEILSYNLLLTNEIVPDTQIYFVEYAPDYFSYDKLKFVTDENGLLSSAETTTESRVAAIVSAIVDSTKKIITQNNTESTPSEITALSDSLVVYWDLNENSKSFTKSVAYIDNDKNPAKLEINLKASIPDAGNSGKGDKKDKVNGVLTRSLKKEKYKIEYSQITSDGSQKILDTNETELLVVDANSTITIPIDRVPFAKGKNDLKFKNGILTTHEIDYPSSIEGFLSIPFSVLRGFTP